MYKANVHAHVHYGSVCVITYEVPIQKSDFLRLLTDDKKIRISWRSFRKYVGNF